MGEVRYDNDRYCHCNHNYENVTLSKQPDQPGVAYRVDLAAFSFGMATVYFFAPLLR